MSEKLPLNEGPTESLVGVRPEEIPGLERWAYEDGEYLIREGERADEFYILEHGAVVVERVGETSDSAPPLVLHAATSDEEELVLSLLQ